MIVPAPVKLPNGCIRCSSQKGPIWEGGVVTAMELTLYVCRTCAEAIALEYGLVEGDEMDRLRDAAAELAQRDAEARKFAAQQADSARIVSGLKGELARMTEQRDEALGLVSTMEHAAQDVRTAMGGLAQGAVPH